jgi:hypothetical protein
VVGDIDLDALELGGSHIAQAESKGVWWGAVVVQASLVRKVGPPARPT